MGTTHRSASHIWDLALRKLFPKRGSLSRETDSHSSWGNLDASAIDDHTDGFYKYSQEVLEKERLRSSNSTTGSYESALMAPTGLPQIPYTVSSPDWNIFSPGVKALSETNDDSICEWLSSVLGVWSRVYSISKVAVMAFMHYGVDLHNTPDSILAHIKRAEKLVTSNSITDLVDNTESMYYALYAALIMELAAADLCASFTLEIRRMVVNRGFVLPEPGQLCKILFLCKQTLDDPSVCVDLNSELVQQHQKEYIRCGVAKVPIAGFVLDDLVGYRQYALTLINDENSEFCQRWNRESVLYEMPPDEVLALQSEKYLAFMPKSTIQRVAPALNLPFIDIDTVHPDIRERDHILDNRQATLAKLEGKCIGEVRCQDTRRRLINLVRERKCICRAVCICATECTENIERYCPCAERMLSLMVAKRRNSIGPLPFGSRCSALAKAIFQGVASIRLDADDKEIAAELDRATMIFAEEIRKQRSASIIRAGTTAA